MNTILIIDPSATATHFLELEIKKELDINVESFNTFKETAHFLEQRPTVHAAIVDPTLKDDAKAQVVDLLISYSIPVLLYSSDLESDLFDILTQKKIVDYVIKSSRNNATTILNLLSQVLRHKQTAILIVDDSNSTRMLMRMMLSNLNLHIFEANGVTAALKTITEHPEIKLVLTDYNMEGQNGIDFTREIRTKRSNKEVAIIGHSAFGNPLLSADFLRNGANDFINKPFQKEDFISRVLMQLDTIDYIQTIKDASEKDFLTGIYNRKYIYEVGRKLFNNAKRGNIQLVCAMIDIDHFKKINDTYGHDIGDKVIIRLAQELTHHFRNSDIVGRIGGEEFCVVLTNPDMKKLETIFDTLRQDIEKLVMHEVDENKKAFSFSFTVSIGVTFVLNNSFEEMLKFADLKLYEAKNYGRNMVVI